MPTILQREGFAFRIWPNDHPPAHVHVINDGGMLVLEFGSAPEDMTIRNVYDMRPHDQKRAIEIAREEWPVLVRAWRKIHVE